MRCNLMLTRTGLLVALVVVALTGCSLRADDDSPTVAYENAESNKPLEVPPDLTRPGTSNSLEVPGRRASADPASAGSGADAAAGQTGNVNVLPEFDGIRLVRGGDTAWLEVEGARPEEIWPQLDDFIRAQGFSVATKKPEIGIIETGWVERSDMPESGGLTGLFQSFIAGVTSDNLRDKYQLRLERGDGATRVFVEHRSMEEVAKQKDVKQHSGFRWQSKGGEPALENEMRQRLLVHLGVAKQRAEGIISESQVVRSFSGTVVLVGAEGEAYSIRVGNSGYNRVFGEVGQALHRIGAETRSADRDEGVYRIDWAPDDPERESLEVDGTRALEVRLQEQDDYIEVAAAGEQGDTRSGPIHRALLRELSVAMGGEAQAVEPSEDGGLFGGSSDDAREGVDAQGPATVPE